MNPPDSQTLEQVFFERMGISVENAVATATDFVDEKVSTAVESGIDVDARLSALGQLLEKLSEPSTMSALGRLLDLLPQLAQLAQVANELPNILATLGDVMDDYQLRCAAEGIDVDKAISNGLQAILYLGSQVDKEHLRRIGDLLGSNILNRHSLNVVDNAAKSLGSAQEKICETASDRIGIFGILGALRDPEVQRSLAFAVQFGKCFGKNLEKSSSLKQQQDSLE